MNTRAMSPKITAFVPIRLNSTRLPKKMLLKLGDKALCHYIFPSLLQTQQINSVYAFCSNKLIMEHIPEGVLHLERDRKLDENSVKGIEIWKSFVELVDSDIYIMAFATAPFVSSKSIEKALSAVASGEYDSAFCVQKFQTFAWYKGQPLNYNLDDIQGTQYINPVYLETNSFFIFRREILTEHSRRIGFKPYMQELDVIESIDIDTKEDFELAQKILPIFLNQNSF